MPQDAPVVDTTAPTLGNESTSASQGEATAATSINNSAGSAIRAGSIGQGTSEHRKPPARPAFQRETASASVAVGAHRQQLEEDGAGEILFARRRRSGKGGAAAVSRTGMASSYDPPVDASVGVTGSSALPLSPSPRASQSRSRSRSMSSDRSAFPPRIDTQAAAGGSARGAVGSARAGGRVSGQASVATSGRFSGAGARSRAGSVASAAAATGMRLRAKRPVLFVRAEGPPDPLLATIPTAYLRNKRVLHLFPGDGASSAFLAEHMHPLHVLGLEPDKSLVRQARGGLSERAACLALAAGLRPGVDLELDRRTHAAQVERSRDRKESSGAGGSALMPSGPDGEHKQQASGSAKPSLRIGPVSSRERERSDSSYHLANGRASNGVSSSSIAAISKDELRDSGHGPSWSPVSIDVPNHTSVVSHDSD